ncbi:MAG: hypothetical protein PWP48_1242 [Clostridiales bacterium]|jgi:hypothetical protein|nr:hypothetical protein [Clostridiales bacterium]MDK2992009.1 hypothetical protein [Clostridiales bacterium]
MHLNWNAMRDEVNELLDTKGFKESLNNKWQLAALLHTEVVELQLADNIEEEELELADLFIRALNLVIANDMDLSGCDFSDTSWMTLLKQNRDFRVVDCLNYAIVQYTEAIKKHKGLTEENHSIIMILQALIQYADILGLDINHIFRRKMDINWGRPYRYGTGMEEPAYS